MRIIIDTNVVISGVFFGGNPRRIIESVMRGETEACANAAIVEEYEEITAEMLARKQGRLRQDLLFPFISKLELYTPVADCHICRDPDDDKFISCAVDAKAVYIVSGDKDLLDVQRYEGIEIITAAEFCERYF